MNQIINGLKEGYWEEYYSNGNVWCKGNYHLNLKEGEWRFYNSEGSIIAIHNYILDKKNGYSEEHFNINLYNTKSILICRNYIDNVIVGYWKKYENDNLTLQKIFI